MKKNILNKNALLFCLAFAVISPAMAQDSAGDTFAIDFGSLLNSNDRIEKVIIEVDENNEEEIIEVEAVEPEPTYEISSDVLNKLEILQAELKDDAAIAWGANQTLNEQQLAIILKRASAIASDHGFQYVEVFPSDEDLPLQPWMMGDNNYIVPIVSMGNAYSAFRVR